MRLRVCEGQKKERQKGLKFMETLSGVHHPPSVSYLTNLASDLGQIQLFTDLFNPSFNTFIGQFWLAVFIDS